MPAKRNSWDSRLVQAISAHASITCIAMILLRVETVTGVPRTRFAHAANSLQLSRIVVAAAPGIIKRIHSVNTISRGRTTGSPWRRIAVELENR